MYISDVITMAESGGLAYSTANLRKVLGALRRCAAIYDTPAAHIRADVALFEVRWGRGKVTTYPLAHFTSADQFRDWRSNVRGAIAQATGARAAAAVRRTSEDDWTELLAVFDANAGRQKDRSGRKLKRFDPKLRIGLERVADYARRDGLQPADLSTAVLVRLRATHAITPDQKAMVGRVARTIDKLRAVPAAAHLLPAEPVGPLPRQRKVGEERRAGLPPAFLADYAAWRSAYERGTPSPLSDSVEGRSSRYMAQFDAALFWLTDAVEALDLADPGTLTQLRAVARPDWITAAARAVLADYDEDGEPANPDVPPRLALRTLKTYLGRLRLLFADLGCAVAAQAVTAMLEDPVLRSVDGMTADNIEFCKTILRSPSRQATFFQLPWTLKDKAQALLDRWGELTSGERHAAIRAGTCAVALLVLIRVAPIRIGNLAAIPFRGRKRWLSEPSAGKLAELLIPAKHVKNQKEIRAHLQDSGRRDSWAIVQWYLDEIRPRMVEGPRGHRKLVAGDALFPGEGPSGAITTSTLRSWMAIETAAAGLPMRPHQARHLIATIMINQHPDKIRQIAALLGDTVRTVETTYAWLDRAKIVAEAQGLVPTAAAILRGARRG